MAKFNFPSGPWKGFYNYRAGGFRHRIDFNLTFSKGAISGSGVDKPGKFTLLGTYDEMTGECRWEAKYIGAHTVDYRGFREGKGIWGVWNLLERSGGFRIWPIPQKRGQFEKMKEAKPIENRSAISQLEIYEPIL